MRPVFVTGLGAFTPVGMNVPQTMGSLLSRLQWFDDLDLLGATGQPVTGARVRLRAAGDLFQRYVGMGQLALAECRRAAVPARAAPGALPLLLATSPPGLLPCTTQELLDGILDGDGDGAVDRAGSAVFAAGRSGALRALAAGVDLLRSGRAPACYVGGVDTMLDPVRLHELLDEGRLADGAGTDGFVPGEGAVFLRLEVRAPPGPALMIAGSAIAGAEAGERPAVPGAALASAAVAALREAGVELAALAALVHDGATEQTTAEEIAMAVTRLPFIPPPPPPPPPPPRGRGAPAAAVATPMQRWAPAFSVGETGAAAAWLALAMVAFFLRERVLVGPVLTWLLSEGVERGAVVMTASGGVVEEAPLG